MKIGIPAAVSQLFPACATQVVSDEFFRDKKGSCLTWQLSETTNSIQFTTRRTSKLLDVQRSLLIYSPKIDTWQLLVHYILHLFPSQLKHITHGSQMRVPQSRIQNKCFPQVNQVSSIKFCYDCSCKHVRHHNLWDSIMVPLCSIIFWARDLIPQPPSLMRKPWELCVWLKLRRGDLECHLTGWLRYRVGLGTPRKKT